MTQTLITRRDKVVAAWLNQVCPVVDPALAADGALTFENAAIDARAADAGEGYHAAVVPLRQRHRPRDTPSASAQTRRRPRRPAPRPAC